MASNENVNCLLEMGFSKERSELADASTTGKGLQAAIDWLLQHPENPVGHQLGGPSSDTQPLGTNEGQVEDAASSDTATVTEDQAPQQPLSLVCEECGKQLRTELDAQAHAARSGHQKFAESSAEIKPMTEEEKKQQLEVLQQKMSARRKEREETEKEEERKREIIRRKSGREVGDARQKHDIAELKKIAEERRREKHDEKLLRQRLKQRIAQDRANMKAQAASNSSASSVPSVVKAETEVKVQEAKDYDSCRIQLRFPDGSVSTGNFKPTDVLSTVHEYAAANGYQGDSPLQLMTTFPRKTFASAEMNETLKDLGLVPSAVVIVQKS